MSNQTTTPTDDQLRELIEMRKKATQGPLEVHEVTDSGEVISRGVRQVNGRGLNQGEDFEMFSKEDAECFAAAVNAIPAMPEELLKLREEYAKLRDEKTRRIYYQDIVYDICQIIDRFNGKLPGDGIVCGMSAEPSTQAQDAVRKMIDDLRNECCFNEGWQEHIGDLLDAMKPFVSLVKESSGRIPTERLSFAHWHSLSKAFGAASAALAAPEAR